METTHQFICESAAKMAAISDNSIPLVVTSPPYPMIAMWDALFCGISPDVRNALQRENGAAAFSAMHEILDSIWKETARVLAPGGFACINIGDATRTMAGQFGLFPNHARILTALQSLGLTPLPSILWRKPTNAPNKFMGSGMLPAGAYVTLEHEYILVARKGGKRIFQTPEEKQLRRNSAFFWEERNRWFSDIWTDLPGTRQALLSQDTRSRSAAFPLDLAWRLIQMYSVYGDTVLDPFCGTGTTLLAAMVAARNSIGYELDPVFRKTFANALDAIPAESRRRNNRRIQTHKTFLAERTEKGKPPRHHNIHLDLAVMTKQETDLRLMDACCPEKKHEDTWLFTHTEFLP